MSAENAGQAAQLDSSHGRGRRTARRPRVNYLELLRAVRENEDPNPDTPAGGQRKRATAAAAASSSVCQGVASASSIPMPLPAPEAEAVEDPGVAGAESRPAKRQRGAKVAAQAVLQQVYGQEEQEEEEAAEAAAGATSRGGSSWQQDAWEVQPPAKLRQKRQRVLVDVHRGTGGGNRGQQQEPEEVENEYERQRLERIRRNEEMLRQLGIQQAASGLAAAVAAERQQGAGGGGGAPLGPPRPRERRPAAQALPLPMRKSARQRGERPLAPEEAVAAAAAELGAAGALDLSQATDKELEHGALLGLEQYFELIGQDISGAVHSDGRFHGWVNPDVCEQYGIEPDPDKAWEAGGGGKFSFKIDKKAIPSNLKGKGWSDARAFSHTQLQKNPNAYFYRHVVPHEQQAQGEWTEEEHQLFVETARAHGVGDKWGLFASYLPQRVGYQCSAYYREVIIPQGLVIDKRFKMTRNGKAVFVG